MLRGYAGDFFLPSVVPMLRGYAGDFFLPSVVPMLWGYAGDSFLPSVVAGRKKPPYGDGLPLGLSMKEMAHGDRQDLSGRSPTSAEEYGAGDRHGMILRSGKSEPFPMCWETRRSVQFRRSDASIYLSTL